MELVLERHRHQDALWDNLRDNLYKELMGIATYLDGTKNFKGLSFDNIEIRPIPWIRIFVSIKTEFRCLRRLY